MFLCPIEEMTMKEKTKARPWLMIAMAVLLITWSCSGIGSTRKNKRPVLEAPPAVSFLAGVSTGGLVENNSLEGIKNISGVDAISGATRIRFSAGVHKEIRYKGLMFESGIDYLAFDQTLAWDMPSFSRKGKRDVRLSQWRMPVTCNARFFKNREGEARLIVKGGISVGYTALKSIADSGTLPEYTFNRWDYGPTLGLMYFPFFPAQDFRLGVFLDVYRGSRIYKDAFHRGEGLGGQSYLKLGIVIQSR